MVVDSSAIATILFGEPEAPLLRRALNRAASVTMSGASLLEISIIVESRLGEAASSKLDAWLAGSPIEVVVVTLPQIEAARQAFRRFGKGRHPAGLNFGDCFSYSLAKISGDSLLYVGNDFQQTDIARALDLS